MAVGVVFQLSHFELIVGMVGQELVQMSASSYTGAPNLCFAWLRWEFQVSESETVMSLFSSGDSSTILKARYVAI